MNICFTDQCATVIWFTKSVSWMLRWVDSWLRLGGSERAKDHRLGLSGSLGQVTRPRKDTARTINPTAAQCIRLAP